MTKKDPFKFTIGFDRKDPEHIRVVDILNDTEKKAQLITRAILHYVGEAQNQRIEESDITNLQPLIAEIAKKEIEKAMCIGQQRQDAVQVSSVSLMETDSLLSLRPEVTHAARNTLKAFRKLHET